MYSLPGSEITHTSGAHTLFLRNTLQQEMLENARSYLSPKIVSHGQHEPRENNVKLQQRQVAEKKGKERRDGVKLRRSAQLVAELHQTQFFSGPEPPLSSGVAVCLSSRVCTLAR